MNVVALPVQNKSPFGQVSKHEQSLKPVLSVVKGTKTLNQENQTSPLSYPQSPSPILVGRDSELAQLHRLFAKAENGERQIVLVSGEAGIGKTTVVDAFLSQIRNRSGIYITSGQCVELYGPGEAYMPLLEATMRLCRGPGSEPRIEALKRYAPSWLVQLPGLIDPDDRTLLQQRAQGASRDRMLREMAEATEFFTAQNGLVVVLEDLHWSDVSTLEWLSYIAQRQEPARLFIIGTYRPMDILQGSHPLRGIVQELTARNRCSELHVTPLSKHSVGEYLTSRFHCSVADSTLSGFIHQRTAGNPLFVVNVVDDLCQQGIVYEEAGQWVVLDNRLNLTESVPDTLRHVIERQVERLPHVTQQLLEVASVVGVEFSAAAVAAGLQMTVEEVEQQCQLLTRQGQFIHTQGIEEWPDNTLCERYSFHHALYRAVLAERVSETRRVRVHRRVGERKALAYGERVGEIAAELAVHFEKGRELTRAVRYLGKAGQMAMRRSAHREAIAHFTRGLELVSTFPEAPEHKKQELALQVALAVPLLRTKGYAAPEVANAYGRARELCQQIGEQPELFTALAGLCSFYLVRVELQTARMLAEQCLRLAQRAQDSSLLVEAHFILGVTLFYSGELMDAHVILEQGRTYYDRQAHSSLTLMYGQDPGVGCRSYASLVSWFLGYPDRALEESCDSLSLARELAHSFSVGAALHTAIWLRQYRQEEDAIQALAEEEIALSEKEGFALWLTVGMIQRGWVLSEQGDKEQGLAQMQKGIAALNATGAKLSQPYHLALLAQAYGKSGQLQEGLALLDQAVAAVDNTEERYYEAEVYRLYGELLLRMGEGETKRTGEKEKFAHSPIRSFISSSPEKCFLKAVDIARRQQAKALELRAVMSLAKLWQQQNKIDDARTLLEEIYGWFTEGVGTKDLQEAETLLMSLGGTAKNPGSSVQSLKSKESEGLRLKVERQSPFSSLPLQPRADSLARSSVLSTHPLPSPDSEPQTLDESCLATSDARHRAPDAVFRSEGESWTVSFAGTTCRLKDTRGLHYIAHLLGHPHQEIHASVLITTSADQSAGSAEESSLQDPHLPLNHADPQTRTAYKQRLSELREELAEAQRFHDLGRSEQIAVEIDLLTQELTSAVGVGGGTRRVGSPAERARVNITRAIKLALRKIDEHHPALGQHLATTIKTGTYCLYTPDIRMPITWQR